MTACRNYPVLLATTLLLVGGCRPAAAPAAQAWSLVATADTAGWIAPCGCTTHQSGGLARCATYVERLRGEHPVVVAEVGGAPAGTSPYDELKFKAILRGELALGVAAHNLGRTETALGPDRLRAIARELAVPFVAANLRDSAGQEVFPALRIVEVAGRRLALVGVISPSLVGSGWQVLEPAPAVLAALAREKQRYDSLAVLAYLPADEIEALARSLSEADLVIGGPTRQSIEPHSVGPVLLTAVTNQGKFLARLDWAPAARPSCAARSWNWTRR